MASIKERPSKSVTCYTVTWRDANGRQCGRTVASKREATILKNKAELWGRVEPDHDRAGKDIRDVRGTRWVKAGPPHRDRNGYLTIAGYADRFLAQQSYSDRQFEFARTAITKYLSPAFPGPMGAIRSSDVRLFFRELDKSKSGALIRKVNDCWPPSSARQWRPSNLHR